MGSWLGVAIQHGGTGMITALVMVVPQVAPAVTRAS